MLTITIVLSYIWNIAFRRQDSVQVEPTQLGPIDLSVKLPLFQKEMQYPAEVSQSLIRQIAKSELNSNEDIKRQ
jgi:hypothetical protein